MFDIVYLDHGNVESADQFLQLKELYPHIQRTRFFGDYLTTLNRIILKYPKTTFFWVINSICDYRGFDFTWEPVPWEDKQLHVFPSGTQKFGDTFLINRHEFVTQVTTGVNGEYHDYPSQSKIAKLEYYKDVNWRTEQTVPRFPYTKLYYEGDQTPFDVVKEYIPKQDKYIWLINDRVDLMDYKLDYNPSLWEPPKIHVFKDGGDVMMVPSGLKRDVSTQLYDYNDILYHDTQISVSKPQDVVFISNGEKNALKNYKKVQLQAEIPYDDRVHYVANVDGRNEAYKAAARASRSPWFFAVFAKCDVVDSFDFMFQPDLLREKCHYIFHAKNPLNGLEYGHQAVIMYNRELVLATEKSGLDFTLNMPHCVVPELSCIARYNVDEWTTWRTAFREVIKLKGTDTVEGKHRLKTWLTVADGDFAEWSIKGAVDGSAFYDEVGGKHDKLMQSYEWAWLDERFKKSS